MPGDAVDHGVGCREARRDLVVAGLAKHDPGDRRPPAKSIAQAHDGTFTLTPRGEGGLRVPVRLPVAPAGVGV